MPAWLEGGFYLLVLGLLAGIYATLREVAERLGN